MPEALNIRVEWTVGTSHAIVVSPDDMRAALLAALDSDHPERARWAERIDLADGRQLATLAMDLIEGTDSQDLFHSSEFSSWLDGNEFLGTDFGPDVDSIEATTADTTA